MPSDIVTDTTKNVRFFFFIRVVLRWATGSIQDEEGRNLVYIQNHTAGQTSESATLAR